MLLEFSGANNESLNQTPFTITNTFSTIKELFVYVTKNHPETQESFFEPNGELKDGVLVIVDNRDWELMGCEETCLEGVSKVVLISSLHGG